MQLVSNGPDIPERLLQAHEDGCVVLFCGAGISRPAGLPSLPNWSRESMRTWALRSMLSSERR